jgi:hypothetical protein
MSTQAPSPREASSTPRTAQADDRVVVRVWDRRCG